MLKADENIDDQVISLLRANPKASNRSIARALGVSEPTASERILRIESAGHAKLAVQWSTKALGLNYFCFLFVEAEYGQQDAVASQLSEIEEINNVTAIMGGHLLGIDLVVPDKESFFEILENGIGRTPGIRSVKFYPFQHVYKLKNNVTTINAPSWFPDLKRCAPRFSADDLDQAIFRELSQNARVSQRELGRLLNENPARIRYRFKRYESENVLQHAFLLDRSVVGHDAGYFVRLLVRPELLKRFARELAVKDWIPFVGIISGEFNILLVAMGEDYASLDHNLGVIQDAVDRSAVINSEVMPMLNSYKVRTDLFFVD